MDEKLFVTVITTEWVLLGEVRIHVNAGNYEMMSTSSKPNNFGPTETGYELIEYRQLRGPANFDDNIKYNMYISLSYSVYVEFSEGF